jgi:serum/glucocorticoid-regulated kinase 2
MAIPDLPFDPSTITRPSSSPPKRKSNFLHTLSRLTSPQRSPRSIPSRTPINVSTPLASPSQELADPFLTPNLDPSSSQAALPGGSSANNSSTITGLAAYLTTISNTADLRQARVWKRFVRVRTDDLESVRAERAIKRVRSDVAAHVVPKSTMAPTTNEDIAIHEAVDEPAVTVIVQEELKEEELKEEEHLERIEETKVEEVILEADDKEVITGDSSVERTEIQEEEQPRPPSATASLETAVAHTTAAITAPAAISRVRSHSADPDKSSRLSRAYVDSTTDQTTGDESSASTTDRFDDLSSDRRRRTPRGKQQQQALTKKKSHRKVMIDDFEMLRVLGKGCAGKVLLVRHKSTSELYALKAITKRHVLAHQELQHTLTEQAVLKRMAAEGRDPFVVKLWWSFHDKENLFLVMVSGSPFSKLTFFRLIFNH